MEPRLFYTKTGHLEKPHTVPWCLPVGDTKDMLRKEHVLEKDS